MSNRETRRHNGAGARTCLVGEMDGRHSCAPAVAPTTKLRRWQPCTDAVRGSRADGRRMLRRSEDRDYEHGVRGTPPLRQGPESRPRRRGLIFRPRREPARGRSTRGRADPRLPRRRVTELRGQTRERLSARRPRPDHRPSTRHRPYLVQVRPSRPCSIRNAGRPGTAAQPRAQPANFGVDGRATKRGS